MATHQKKHVQKHCTITKELVTKDDTLHEKYAEITRPTGDCKFDCRLLDGSITNATLVGRLVKGPKKQRINIGDFVLIQALECHTEKEKYYIIHKYTPDEKKKLIKNGELAQVKTTEDIGTTVVMEGDVSNITIAETQIDDDFIDSI
jgi:initiation factor 1A